MQAQQETTRPAPEAQIIRWRVGDAATSGYRGKLTGANADTPLRPASGPIGRRAGRSGDSDVVCDRGAGSGGSGDGILGKNGVDEFLWPASPPIVLCRLSQVAVRRRLTPRRPPADRGT